MIPITPAIIGPGIEEEYADALQRIEQLEKLLAPYSASNDTPHGRMVFLLGWLRQEIEAERLPIPLDRKYWGTLGRLIAEGRLDSLGCGLPMRELARVLKGVGLIKERHYPVVVALIDDFLELLKPVPNPEPRDLALIRDLRRVRDELVAGKVSLPLAVEDYPGCKTVFFSDQLEALPNFDNRRTAVMLAVFDGWRPEEAEKGQLEPPKPDLVWGGP